MTFQSYLRIIVRDRKKLPMRGSKTILIKIKSDFRVNLEFPGAGLTETPLWCKNETRFRGILWGIKIEFKIHNTNLWTLRVIVHRNVRFFFLVLFFFCFYAHPYSHFEITLALWLHSFLIEFSFVAVCVASSSHIFSLSLPLAFLLPHEKAMIAYCFKACTRARVMLRSIIKPV